MKEIKEKQLESKTDEAFDQLFVFDCEGINGITEPHLYLTCDKKYDNLAGLCPDCIAIFRESNRYKNAMNSHCQYV